MATVTRVRRLVNPRRRRNAGLKRRRKLTPAQIRAGFGGKRAKSARRAALRRKRLSAGGLKNHRRRKSNPKPRVRTITKIKYRTKTIVKRVNAKAKRRRRTTRKTNPGPGLLVTFGPALNPRRRTKKVAKRRARRRKNARATRTRTIVRYRTRARRNPSRRHHRRRTHRRGNPSFGGGGNMLKQVGGVLLGMGASKMIPSMVSTAIPSLGASPLTAAAVSAAVAYGGSMVVGKMGGPEFGKYFLLGGLAQTGSLLLNAFLPSVGSAIGLSGLVPSNDIMLPYNMFSGRGAMISAGSPGAARGGRGGFAPAFAN